MEETIDNPIIEDTRITVREALTRENELQKEKPINIISNEKTVDSFRSIITGGNVEEDMLEAEKIDAEKRESAKEKYLNWNNNRPRKEFTTADRKTRQKKNKAKRKSRAANR